MNQIIKKTLVIALMIITACAFTLETPETVCAASKCSKPKISNYTNDLCDEITLSYCGGGKNANIFFVYMKETGGSYEQIATAKTSKGAEKSTVVQGLNPSTDYSFKVRAANVYKKKQYYNSKNKKWQNKRPKKKNWKGKKTRKVTAYRWYSSYSSAKTIRTADQVTGGQQANDANALPFPVYPDIQLVYGSTTIYLGQDWTSGICKSLKNASNGYESVVRPQCAKSPTTFKPYDTTVHMFDINDYSSFLAVYVANGQIVRWVTNGPLFGIVNGKAVEWGDNVKNYEYGSAYGRRTNGGACNNLFTDIDRGDSVVGGFASYQFSADPSAIESEKRIGFHSINAYRVRGGLPKLTYADGLDGKNYTWSGTVDGLDFTNVRYGAQPFVETAYASNTVAHDTGKMSSGPLAGISVNTRDSITYMATGIRVYGEIVATGMTGESCLGTYMSSNSHMLIMLDPNYTKIGIGMCGSYNGCIFSK